MSDINSLLQEIDEDLQHQKFLDLWKKHGNLVVSIALAIILTTAGITGWNSWRTNAHQKETGALLQIMGEKDGEEAKKIESLEDFAKKGDATTQAVLARFEAAFQTLKKGDADKAASLYDDLAKDEKIEPAFRQLAGFYSVQAQFDKGDPAVLMARLQPLLADSAWRFSAKEYAAHLALKMGDKEKAKQLFGELGPDSGAPSSIVDRAHDMLRWLNGGE
jgi:hypothetical protein